MRFSERIGYRKPKVEIQKESMDEELRNGLWSCVNLAIFDNFYDRDGYNDEKGYHSMQNLIHKLWLDHFKKPIDKKPCLKDTFLLKIRQWFFGCEWCDIYDFIEFIIGAHDDSDEIKDLVERTNNILKRELSGYRIVSSKIMPITSERDIKEIENASVGPIKEVNDHLGRAVELLSDRKKPDYRNSIKESVSAVETLCKVIVKNDKATLGDALNMLQQNRKVKLHKALLEAYKSLYGYTSDADGIRHSLMEETKLDLEDAYFMLVICSSFINYLVEKSSKSGIEIA